MFENIPAVELAVGRSTVRQKILALLTTEPRTRLHLREIQRRVGTSPGTASRELARLVAGGLVEREAEGSQVYFQAADTPYAAMMRSLLAMAPVVQPGPEPRRRNTRTRSGAPQASQAAEPAETGAPAASDRAADEPSSEVSADEPSPRDSGEPSGAGVAVPSPDPLGLVVAARVAAAIRPLYGARLRGVYLFGARSASPAPEESDVELMIVLDDFDSYGAELERTSSVVAELSLELGLIVSRLFISEADWTGGMDGQLPLIRGEAVAI